MTAPSSVIEQTDIVRKRRFAAHSIDDVVRVLQQMKLEGFQGFVRINMSGGRPNSAEVEERAKMLSIDKLP